MNEKVIDLRAIDRKRVNAVYERMQAIPDGNNIWYIHTVLAQCFLPYKDPKKAHWQKQNGDYSIILTWPGGSEGGNAGQVVLCQQWPGVMSRPHVTNALRRTAERRKNMVR